MLNCEPIMNYTQATDATGAVRAPEFGDSLAGILAAIALAGLLSGLALALAHWPAETLRWSAIPLLLAALGLGGLAPRGWPGR